MADLLLGRVKQVTEVKTKVVFGKAEDFAGQLARSPVSKAINTSFVERNNLAQRQANRCLIRKIIGFSKDRENFWLFRMKTMIFLPNTTIFILILAELVLKY